MLLHQKDMLWPSLVQYQVREQHLSKCVPAEWLGFIRKRIEPVHLLYIFLAFL